jgi:hypothetical protein
MSEFFFILHVGNISCLDFPCNYTPHAENKLFRHFIQNTALTLYHIIYGKCLRNILIGQIHQKKKKKTTLNGIANGEDNILI